MKSLLLVTLTVSLATTLIHPSSTIFALHDSHLDVNTWLASDNITELQTIDLNQVSQSSVPEETTDETTEETPDENGDETTEETPDENGDETTSSEDEDDSLFDDDDENGEE